MSILGGFIFVEESRKPVKPIADPMVRAKQQFIDGLEEQKRFAGLMMTGQEIPKRSRVMFWVYGGKYRFKPRVGLDALEIVAGKPEVEVADLPGVISLCDLLIQATRDGELNDPIRGMLDKRPLRGRAAGKAKLMTDGAPFVAGEKPAEEPVGADEAPAAKRTRKKA